MKNYVMVGEDSEDISIYVEKMYLGTISALMALGIEPPIRISASDKSHTCGYKNAEIFINLSNRKSSASATTASINMLRAIELRIQGSARVGASVMTQSGTIYTSVERQPKHMKFAKNRVLNDFQNLVYSNNSSIDYLTELVDCSTSIHAEMDAVLSAMKKFETPYLLATSRIPCLSCCRFLRAVEIPHVIYFEDDLVSDDNVVSDLRREALDGLEMALFEGLGGRVDVHLMVQV